MKRLAREACIQETVLHLHQNVQQKEEKQD
jgi:hypothetical protein